jgi:hypothetical protein
MRLDGELVFFWFCILISTLLALSQFLWGSSSSDFNSGGYDEFDGRYGKIK